MVEFDSEYSRLSSSSPALFSIRELLERKKMKLDPTSDSGIVLKKPDVGIVAGYCIYREAEFLRSSLDSVCQYVDVIAILDGRFKDFKELPDDGTGRIISETASRYDPQYYASGAMTQKFAVFESEPMSEVEKRDLLFQLVKPGRFLFEVDGDEICVGDVKTGLDFVRANAARKTIFWVYVEEEGNPGWQPRIIKMEPGIHHGSKHWVLLDAKGDVITEDRKFVARADFAQIEQFKIWNFGSKRTGRRQQERIAYREIMRKRNWAEH